MTTRFTVPRDAYWIETLVTTLTDSSDSVIASSAVAVARSKKLLIKSEALSWDHTDRKVEWEATRAASQVSVRRPHGV